jgi:hypothetical protein
MTLIHPFCIASACKCTHIILRLCLFLCVCVCLSLSLSHLTERQHSLREQHFGDFALHVYLVSVFSKHAFSEWPMAGLALVRPNYSKACSEHAFSEWPLTKRLALVSGRPCFS